MSLAGWRELFDLPSDALVVGMGAQMIGPVDFLG